MTCHLQVHISPITIVAKKSGNVFFVKNPISKSFQPKNTFLTSLDTYKSIHQFIIPKIGLKTKIKLG